jgi:hypothetical protein
MVDGGDMQTAHFGVKLVADELARGWIRAAESQILRRW